MKKDPAERIAVALEAIAAHFGRQEKRDLDALKREAKERAEDEAFKKHAHDEATKAYKGQAAFQEAYGKQMQQLIEEARESEARRKEESALVQARLDTQERLYRELQGLPPKAKDATLHVLKPVEKKATPGRRVPERV